MRNLMVLVGLALFFGASASHASIPGNLEERSNEGLLHVCVDGEPGDADYIVCDDQLDDFSQPYSGLECEAEGLPASCELDFIPKVRIKGIVTIIYDEDPKNAGNNDVPEQTGLVLKLRVKKKQVRLYDLFQGSKLGNWNPIGNEGGLLSGGINYTNGSMTAFQFSNGNLTDLGEKIVSVVDPAYPGVDLSETLPLVTFMERFHDVDASGDDPTGTASMWKITLEFVRVRD